MYDSLSPTNSAPLNADIILFAYWFVDTAVPSDLLYYL
jgi:hypothetical protein